MKFLRVQKVYLMLPVINFTLTNVLVLADRTYQLGNGNDYIETSEGSTGMKYTYVIHMYIHTFMVCIHPSMIAAAKCVFF